MISLRAASASSCLSANCRLCSPAFCFRSSTSALASVSFDTPAYEERVQNTINRFSDTNILLTEGEGSAGEYYSPRSIQYGTRSKFLRQNTVAALRASVLFRNTNTSSNQRLWECIRRSHFNWDILNDFTSFHFQLLELKLVNIFHQQRGLYRQTYHGDKVSHHL